jgi:hypothetical protein
MVLNGGYWMTDHENHRKRWDREKSKILPTNACERKAVLEIIRGNPNYRIIEKVMKIHHSLKFQTMSSLTQQRANLNLLRSLIQRDDWQTFHVLKVEMFSSSLVAKVILSVRDTLLLSFHGNFVANIHLIDHKMYLSYAWARLSVIFR